MTATNHGLFGAVIAITLHKYPAAAIVLAPFSHFLLDAIPHFGGLSIHSKKFFKLLKLDATVAVLSTLWVAYLWPADYWLVVICAFLSASPDLMWIYYEYINPKLKKVHAVPRFHSWIQWSQTGRGAIVEFVWFGTLLVGLTYFGTV